MSVKTFKKNFIFTFLDFVAVFGQDKIGHSKLSQSSSADHPLQRGIRKYEHPTQQGSFHKNDGVGEQPADQVSVNIINL